MIVVKILGSGCANCKRLEQIVRQILLNTKLFVLKCKWFNFRVIGKAAAL